MIYIVVFVLGLIVGFLAGKESFKYGMKRAIDNGELFFKNGSKWIPFDPRSDCK